MVHQELLRKWERIEALLQSVLAVYAEQEESTTASSADLIGEAQHFMSHNELALALDSLAGRVTEPGADFLEGLALAAAEMELEEKTPEFRERCVLAVSKLRPGAQAPD